MTRHNHVESVARPALPDNLHTTARNSWDALAPELVEGTFVHHSQLGNCTNKMKYDSRKAVPASLVRVGLAPWSVKDGARMVKLRYAFADLITPPESLIFDLPRPEPLTVGHLDHETVHRRYLDRIGLWQRLLGIPGLSFDGSGDQETVDVDVPYWVGDVETTTLGTRVQTDIHQYIQSTDPATPSALVVGEGKKSGAVPIESIGLRQIIPSALAAQSLNPGTSVVPAALISDTPLVRRTDAGYQVADTFNARVYLFSLPTKDVADVRLIRACSIVVNHYD
jgi:hypothetical protein